MIHRIDKSTKQIQEPFARRLNLENTSQAAVLFLDPWILASEFWILLSLNLGSPRKAEDSIGTEGQNQQEDPKGNEIPEGGWK